jgi:hypothetical protein
MKHFRKKLSLTLLPPFSPLWNGSLAILLHQINRVSQACVSWSRRKSRESKANNAPCEKLFEISGDF